MRDIPSRYNAKEVEKVLYSQWEKARLFQAGPLPSRKSFTIVIPPPNITGILHMGHALNNTLQDILIRWKRMQGFSSLWVPGTDHAGIATQNVVERKLAQSDRSRDDLGREEFIKEVWKWRDEYGSTIISQLKRLGCSCDWERTRFTMDEGLSAAVLETFVRLYNKGLVYRGDYIINWCPRCQTALSDEEAPHVEVEGKLYYICYPFKQSRDTRYEIRDTNDRLQGITVATTRPETMLGDVAVAVNPKDARYKKLIGKKLILPIVERDIDIIADDFVDKKFGTGAVKVTPGHDPNDFEIGRRHGLSPVIAMNPDATMNENAGRFNGVDRFQAREAIVEELKEKGLLLKVESHHHAVGHCYRCHTVVEPYLSRQWFVKMKPLAKPAIEAVKKGRIKFYPKRWTKVYLNWMENIRDWCISRQIWWGHRIPVYYCKDCPETAGVIVSKTRPAKCPGCNGTNLTQDNDVLDTWFSSWLWPFSTLGWPEKSEDLKYFYPTDALVTAPEILFFWVARMIMAGMEFMGEIPFKHVYIHGTVRDLTGKKMSKSLGNIIDPIDIIDKFGADALRYSMIAITATGQDVFLSEEKFEIGRNFANKIWNASRFVLMNVECTSHESRVTSHDLSLADKWILSRLNQSIAAVTKSLEQYRFNEAEMVLYDFFWHEFCDWYVEMVKPDIIRETRDERRQTTEQVLIHILENSLRLLHPFMPFVTEAVWQNIMERKSIMVEPWPKPDKACMKKNIDENMEIIKTIIVSIRNIRSDMNIPYSQKIKACLVPLKKGPEVKLKGALDYIRHLARLEELVVEARAKKPAHCATAVLEGFNVFIPLEGIIDFEAEKARLTKKKEDLEAQLRFIEKKLENKNFVNKAPEKVVNLEKQRAKNLKEQIARLKETLKGL